MEVSLPNFESLEKRVKQLSEEVSRVREKQQKEGVSSISISEESKKQIEQKIRNLLDFLEEF